MLVFVVVESFMLVCVHINFIILLIIKCYHYTVSEMRTFSPISFCVPFTCSVVSICCHSVPFGLQDAMFVSCCTDSVLA